MKTAIIWIGLLALLLAIAVAGVCYIIRRVAQFNVIKRHFITKRKPLIISTVIVLAVLAALTLALGALNAVICFIHALLIWLICDFTAFIIRKMRKVERRRYVAGGVAIVFTVLYLGAGFFFAHFVFDTKYDLQTAKTLPQASIKIVGFSDSHIGETFHFDGFAKHIDRMNAENADIAVIVGDFIDDDTSREDMEKSCEALSKLKAKYGTYFVMGNHDARYYESLRGYGKAELIENLQKNGVTVLKDEVVNVAENLYICGRKDATDKDRKDINNLTESIPDNAYVIVLDHQPTDYETETESGADLVISGHTHGGQFIPINRIGEWLNINDATYGYQRRENTDFIVSSGLADWALDFKTGCISEYISVTVTNK